MYKIPIQIVKKNNSNTFRDKNHSISRGESAFVR